MTDTAVMLCGHGSRDPEAIEVTHGSIDVFGTDPVGAVEALAAQGVSRVVVPAFLYLKGPEAGLGAFGNAGRNTFPLRRIDNVDFQILKRFNLTEHKRLEVGAQASNVFNHPQWTGDLLNDVYPNALNNSRSFLLTGNPQFGRFDQFYTSNPRTTTIVARFVF